jgi:hypothetical protein
MILADGGNLGFCRFHARLPKGIVFAMSPLVVQR